MEESIFQPYLGTRTIFKMDREILRPSYLPERLPHRESHIGQLAQIIFFTPHGKFHGRPRVGPARVWIPYVGGEELNEAASSVLVGGEQLGQRRRAWKLL